MKKAALLIISIFALLPLQPVLAQQTTSESDTLRESAKARAEEARQKALDRIGQIKQQVEDRRVKIKQDVCERREQRLQTVISHLSTRATTVKNVLDRMYERVQDFYESGQLTVENYNELNDAVAAAQADAGVAVEAISDYQFELDCENPKAGEQLDAFRSVVGTAKDSLKEYRRQLVALISSLRAEAAEREGSSAAQGSQHETEEEDAQE